MNITKTDVLSILKSNPGEFFTTRTIMNELHISEKDEMRQVSRALYRLYRKHPDVNREPNCATFKYRFVPETHKSPNILPLSKSASDKKARGDSDGFTFIETIEPEENLCELCGLWCEVVYQAEKNGCRVFLCKKHGERVDKLLGGYGGAFSND